MKRAYAAFFFFIASAAFAGSHFVATKAALATASPYSTSAGLAVLRNGGNAIDAAVAVSFALSVVHPQAGNLGGGGFLVYFDAATHEVWTLDYREIAPMGAKRDMYLQKDGMPGPATRTGALASGVPGTVAGLAAMHKRFGSKSWKELVAPSAAMARDGMSVDEELERELGEEQKDRKIDQYASTSAIFFPNGKPLARGSKLVQLDLASTLERISTQGPSDFYEGETAKRIVESMKAGGGLVSYRDLRDYKPVWRAPLKLTFGDYAIYTMPPPSAGGVILGEALNILSAYDLAASGFQTTSSIHLQVEAERRAYIDRNHYIGDPIGTRIPMRELLSSQRAAQWRASIDMKHVTPTSTLSEPGLLVAESNHTTHFSIVDQLGNIAAVTTTLNENFGNGIVVAGAGFFMNNEMDDFTAVPGKPNRYGMIQSAANAIEPGRKMTSSMTPAIVLRKGQPFLALGTRGGPAIPTTILQVLLNVIVYKKPLVEAIAAPRYHHQAVPDRIDYERTLASQTVINALNALGHPVNARESIGDVQAIGFENGAIIAVSDSRRGGAAGGF